MQIHFFLLLYKKDEFILSVSEQKTKKIKASISIKNADKLYKMQIWMPRQKLNIASKKVLQRSYNINMQSELVIVFELNIICIH